jgi:O-acetyl-ADP-ribose deacetylase (regulator of RNase III)
VWSGGRRGEREKLTSCYERAIALAAENGIESIAFPSISTGAYRYPIEEAARIAVNTIRKCVAAQPSVKLVRFVCFSDTDFDTYRSLLEESR